MPVNTSLGRTTIDLLQGTLAVLILKALSHEPMHGYGIARWIEDTSEDGLLVEEGSLYPALRRLEARGWITSQWRVSSTNRRVKTYTLTGDGQQQLRAELAQWGRFSAAISRVLKSRKPRTA
jgi:PadR family transcriptional regulator, regulatory protein PadR